MPNGYYTLLPNRAAVAVAGPDARDFLQGLVTQDVGLLDSQKLLYAALLNPQGRILFDFFLCEKDDTVFLECEMARAEALAARLKTFILRKNVAIKIVQIQVIAAWNTDADLTSFSFAADPRHEGLGWRKILFEPLESTALSGFEEKDFDFYDRLRLTLAIPDGSRDIAAGEDTVADFNLEKLNGVSFTKGCYMGQELTSRMHHRALAKRGLYPVKMTDEPLPPHTDLLADGNLIGEMRSSNGDLGLAMLRHDSLKLAHKAGLEILE